MPAPICSSREVQPRVGSEVLLGGSVVGVSSANLRRVVSQENRFLIELDAGHPLALGAIKRNTLKPGRRASLRPRVAAILRSRADPQVSSTIVCADRVSVVNILPFRKAHQKAMHPDPSRRSDVRRPRLMVRVPRVPRNKLLILWVEEAFCSIREGHLAGPRYHASSAAAARGRVPALEVAGKHQAATAA